MTKLDCTVVTCTYNSNKKCKRDNITVGGNEAIKPSETACESFYPKGTNTMTSLDNDGPKTALNVACKAVTCVYNKDKKCTADSKKPVSKDTGFLCPCFPLPHRSPFTDGAQMFFDEKQVEYIFIIMHNYHCYFRIYSV